MAVGRKSGWEFVGTERHRRSKRLGWGRGVCGEQYFSHREKLNFSLLVNSEQYFVRAVASHCSANYLMFEILNHHKIWLDNLH